MTITYDTVASSANSSAHSSRTFSHTVASGDNRLLVVTANYRTTSSSSLVTGITYNGASLTSACSKSTTKYAATYYAWTEIWYIVAPDTGAHNVVVSYSTNVDEGGYVSVSYAGVDQTNPLTSTNTTGASSSSVSSSSVTMAAGSLLLSGVTQQSYIGNRFTPGSGVTELVDNGIGFGANDIGYGFFYRIESSGGSYTINATSSQSTPWAQATANFAPDGITSVTGSATGVATATAVGSGTVDSVFSSSASASAIAVGARIVDAAASASVSSTAIAVGTEVRDGVGSATSVSSASAVSSAILDGVASANAASTAQAVGAAIDDAAAIATSTATGTAVGASQVDASASATASSLAIADSSGATDAVASALGVATANAVGDSQTDASGLSSSSSTAIAVSQTSTDANAFALGASSAQAPSSSLTDAEASASAVATATAIDGSLYPAPPVYLPVPGAGGAPYYIPPATPLTRVRFKKARKPYTHVMKVGEWPEEVTPVEVKKQEKLPVDDDRMYIQQALDNLDSSNDDDDDDEEVLKIILALVA